MNDPGDPGDRPPRPLLAEPIDERDMLVETRDLVSASRSCLAIITLLAIIVLLVCVFLTVQVVR